MVKELIDKHNRKKIVLFFNRVENSKKFASDNGFLHVDGSCNRKQKEFVLNKFMSSEFSVICNVNIISEGVSIPCIDCLIFAEPRQSSIGVIQNIGRALRKHPSKDIALICLPPNMADAVSIINILYHEDPKFRKGTGMFIGNRYCIKEIENIVRLIEISKTGGLWEYKYRLCQEYEEKHGLIKGEQVIFRNINIRKWISRQMNKEKNNVLTENKIILINELKTVKILKTNKWKLMCNLVVEYEEQNGLVIGKKCVHKGHNISAWITVQIRNIREHKLNKDETTLINNLKTVKYRKSDKWMITYNLCIEYELLHGLIVCKNNTKDIIYQGGFPNKINLLENAN